MAAGGMHFGLIGQLQCWNCAPFSQRIKLSSYNPMNYDPEYPQMNCYDYHDGYCWSPTASGIPWKSAWGFGAACPPDWPYGTWVEIETVGTFICLDRGNEIKCKDGICNVDLLGPGGSWNGLEFDATLWVPLSPK
jgi:3D (Asp-Asp-Asp) domain-containing protein